MVIHVWYRYTTEAAFAIEEVPCAVCHKFLKFDFEGLTNEGGRWQCECGAQFHLKGPTLYLLNASAPPRRYMKWNWWGKGAWRPQSPE